MNLSSSTLLALSLTAIGLAAETRPAAPMPRDTPGFTLHSRRAPAGQDAIAERDATCLVNPEDPYEPGTRIRQGEFKDRCLDVSEQRPVLQLPQAEATRLGAGADEIVFANFRHDGRFWLARVQPLGIQEVRVQEEHFPGPAPAAHTQLMFRMLPGQELWLTPQVPGDLAAPRRLRDFVYSAEAAGPAGFKFDLGEGFGPHFTIINRLVSVADRARVMIEQDHHRVEQIPLNLTRAESAALLRGILHKSESEWTRHLYNTASKNCTTELYRSLEQNVPRGLVNQVATFLSPVTNALPTQAGSSLFRRGYVDMWRRGFMPTLNEELAARPTASAADPFAGNGLIPTGRFHGRPVEGARGRSVTLLEESLASRYGLSPADGLVFANFRHEDRFWVAQIDPNAVEEVAFQVAVPQGSNTPFAHTQLRLRLRAGHELRLVSQDQSRPRETRTVRDFVYSVEGVTPEGGTFSLNEGLTNAYPIAYRAVSLDDTNRYYAALKQNLEETPLALSGAEKNALLEHALITADQAGLRNLYNSLLTHCTSEIFRILDESLSNRGTRYQLDVAISRLRTQLFTRFTAGALAWRHLRAD